jgi:hypothetical protein
MPGSPATRARRHELLVFAVVLAALAPAGQRNPWSTGKLWDDGLELTEIVASVDTSFADIERVIGFPLPPSCRDHQPHWHSYRGIPVVRAIIDAGGGQRASTSNEKGRLRSVGLMAVDATVIP